MVMTEKIVSTMHIVYGSNRNAKINIKKMVRGKIGQQMTEK